MSLTSGRKGQAMLMTVLILGIIMAAVVIFGAKRHEDVSQLIDKLDASQVGYEVLSGAAKRVQSIYANESACDPDVLDIRLSEMPNLEISAGSLGFNGVTSYAVAQPTLTADAARANRCEDGLKGCRQIAVPMETSAYVVTVGRVVRGPDRDGDDNRVTEGAYPDRECPRDAIVRLSTTIRGATYQQKVSLINTCTMVSCDQCSGSNPNCAHPSDNFTDTATAQSGEGAIVTDACGGLLERYYGSMVSEASPSGYNYYISPDDLRLARRYLETGGAGIGDTSQMDFATAPSAGANLACAVASSASQCVGRPCVPAFDLNRDRTNNESDLAILEAYLRGYLSILPASLLDARY